ncbi:uncharacterized protein Bfra_010101 [Botrytis fragariae]|uniref:LysM domain-containing protein n=1 Tax=Botrytis fragariae TaxID=1964551 RepID=A0A8H6EF66_9HELO|nr:uncharacterized protein Bfra_010101 [Botrytis fragariae]KAF5869956.1 hypothetical protein Bfra_010101 [Botrytis fragariae]
MKLFLLTTWALSSLLGASPGTAAPGASEDCSAWVQQSYSLTCADIEAYYGITEVEFEAWNPIVTELGTGCSLIAELYYCVSIDYLPLNTPSAYTPTGTSVSLLGTGTGTSTPTSTAPSTATAPSPLEPSTDPSCTSYHYVVSGDSCSAIEEEYGITADEFNAWNPHVGTGCAYLDLDEYVCVGALYKTTAAATATSATATTSSTSSTLSYPTPLQPSSFTNCSEYHLVVSGDYCALIEEDYGITATQFNDWNPGVGNTCLYLELGAYVCVGAPIPSPLEPGTIATCTEFHFVVSGDYCALIEETYGITTAQFNLWNPEVGTDCAYLDLGEYVCVAAPA